MSSGLLPITYCNPADLLLFLLAAAVAFRSFRL
jgi:hypothetical protein